MGKLLRDNSLGEGNLLATGFLLHGLLLAGEQGAYASCLTSALESSSIIVQGLFLSTDSGIQEAAAQSENLLERTAEVVREKAVQDRFCTGVGIPEDKGHVVDGGIRAGHKQVQ